MKFIILLVAIFSTLALAQAARPRFDAREVMRLIATVNPETCRCGFRNDCEIEIPNIKILGIDCVVNAGPGSVFCCNSRSFIKPFVTPSDLAALHAAAKRLKVDKNVEKLVTSQLNEEPTTTTTSVATTTTQFELSIADGQKAIAKAVTAPTTTTATTIATTTEEATSASPKPTTDADDALENDYDCVCVNTNTCDKTRMDFTFGKSCPFGKVRCCPELITTTTTLATTSGETPRN